MKTSIFLILIIAVSFISLSAQNQTSLGLKLNKSLTVASCEIEYLLDGQVDYKRRAELISGTMGIGADFNYKASKQSYLNISLIYSSYDINENIKYMNDGKLEVSSFDFTINGNYYFDDPNGFTPYAGGGGGFIFINSNEDELIREYEGKIIETEETDYLSELNLFFNAKIGLHIPVTKKAYCYTEFDFNIATALHLGIIPKLTVGASYWLD